MQGLAAALGLAGTSGASFIPVFNRERIRQAEVLIQTAKIAVAASPGFDTLLIWFNLEEELPLKILVNKKVLADLEQHILPLIEQFAAASTEARERHGQNMRKWVIDRVREAAAGKLVSNKPAPKITPADVGEGAEVFYNELREALEALTYKHNAVTEDPFA